MTTIATLGPQGSHAWQATRLYKSNVDAKVYSRIPDVVSSFEKQQADLAIIPVYNTREGEIKGFFRLMEKLTKGYWIDNIMLPIHLSLGAMDTKNDLTQIIGTSTVLKQCEDYIAAEYPDASLMAVHDIDRAIEDVTTNKLVDRGIIETEEILRARNLAIREREIVSHNRTRFAVLGPVMTKATGYDATAMISAPLKDRVGLLFDILGEFSRRSINILDLRSESDIKTQRLQIYIEIEGHIESENIVQAVRRIEEGIIQETGALKVLGSFPRIDMRTKHIESFGFIGTGDMSRWFADRLHGEGYKTILTGRSTKMQPAEMISQVDVVVICVPISVTPETIRQFGPLLKNGQALIILAGEAENTLNTAMDHTAEGIEIMLVHNLWGPQVANMKDKVASVVRTRRSGPLCSEFEAFLYKHGAEIYQDTPKQHDLLMGVGQKLPTSTSVAMAMAFKQNNISPEDIGTHATLTSLYGILAMSRIHFQNPRTYAEIISTQGDGRKIVRDFITNLTKIQDLADAGKIDDLCTIIDANKKYLTSDFLEARMSQALAVDQTLGKVIGPRS